MGNTPSRPANHGGQNQGRNPIARLPPGPALPVVQQAQVLPPQAVAPPRPPQPSVKQLPSEAAVVEVLSSEPALLDFAKRCLDEEAERLQSQNPKSDYRRWYTHCSFSRDVQVAAGQRFSTQLRIIYPSISSETASKITTRCISSHYDLDGGSNYLD